jgi:TPR repeat protein
MIELLDKEFGETIRILQQKAENYYPKSKIIRDCFLILIICIVQIASASSKIENNFLKGEISSSVQQQLFHPQDDDLHDIKQQQRQLLKQYQDEILALAETGDRNAQYITGLIYSGSGNPNYQEASKWFLKAAEQDVIEAQAKLGTMYANGLGVVQDYNEAYKWIFIAASKRNKNAEKYKDFLKAKLSSQKIEEIENRIKESLQKKAKEQTAPILEPQQKGDFYGILEIFRAAKNDDSEMQYNLGQCYFEGLGVVQNYKEANIWLYKAAENDHYEAQCYLGVCCAEGQGIKQDYNEAIKWFRRSAENGNDFAGHKLGLCYYNGLGVEQNYREAYKWFSKAADKGLANAQFNLGVMYAEGQGVDKNANEAYRLISLAATQGDENAVRLKTMIDKELIAKKQKQTDEENSMLKENSSTSTELKPKQTTDDSSSTVGEEVGKNKNDNKDGNKALWQLLLFISIPVLIFVPGKSKIGIFFLILLIIAFFSIKFTMTVILTILALFVAIGFLLTAFFK